jgi:hypothetical protein
VQVFSPTVALPAVHRVPLLHLRDAGQPLIGWKVPKPSSHWLKPLCAGIQPELPVPPPAVHRVLLLHLRDARQPLIGWKVPKPSSHWLKPLCAGIQPELPVPLPAVHRVPLLHLRDAGQPEPGASGAHLRQVRHSHCGQDSGQDTCQVSAKIYPSVTIVLETRQKKTLCTNA